MSGSGVDIYFIVLPEQVLTGYRMALIPDNDVLALDVLINAVELYRDSEKAIVKYRADAKTIAVLQEHSGCETPLTQEAVDALGFTGSYIGRSLADVIEKYPELDGYTESQDLDGNIKQESIISDVIIL